MENTEDNNEKNDEMKRQVQSILEHKDGTNPVKISLSEDDEKYLCKFSFAAMSFSTIYFWAMGDKQFAMISLVGGAIFPPILFILPFLARARSWKLRQWYDFAEFRKIQKIWDSAAIYGLILLVVIIYLSFQFILLPLFQSLMSSFGQTDISGLMETVNELTNY